MRRVPTVVLILCGLSLAACSKNANLSLHIDKNIVKEFSGTIMRKNYEFEFFPSGDIFVEGEKIKDCVSVVPNLAAWDVMNKSGGKSVKVMVKGAFYDYPDGLGIPVLATVSSGMQFACPFEPVLLIDEFLSIDEG